VILSRKFDSVLFTRVDVTEFRGQTRTGRWPAGAFQNHLILEKTIPVHRMLSDQQLTRSRDEGFLESRPYLMREILRLAETERWACVLASSNYSWRPVNHDLDFFVP
jgi:hypothetical protein